MYQKTMGLMFCMNISVTLTVGLFTCVRVLFGVFVVFSNHHLAGSIFIFLISSQLNISYHQFKVFLR